MRSISLRQRLATGALAFPLILGVAACGDDAADDAGAADAPATTMAPGSTMVPATTTAPGSTTMPSGSGAGGAMADTPVGPACGQVPTSGEGSVAGMADDPVATAASNNPLLSTLVQAVTAADLVGTLNSGGPWTVFAPIDPAFAAVPAADLDALLADTDALTEVLTYHVVPGRLGLDDVVGTHETVQGASLEVTGGGQSFQVNGVDVVCAGVATANASVYLVDEVLMPPAA